MFNLKWLGINELITANTKMIKRIQQYKDFEEMLDKIVAKAKHNAPVKTGRLRDSIRWEKRGIGVYALICDVPYAKYIEYGTRYYPVGDVTSPRGYKSSSGKMASVPFLRSAIWDVQREFPGMIDGVINIIYN